MNFDYEEMLHFFKTKYLKETREEMINLLELIDEELKFRKELKKK